MISSEHREHHDASQPQPADHHARNTVAATTVRDVNKGGPKNHLSSAKSIADLGKTITEQQITLLAVQQGLCWLRSDHGAIDPNIIGKEGRDLVLLTGQQYGDWAKTSDLTSDFIKSNAEINAAVQRLDEGLDRDLAVIEVGITRLTEK